MTRIRRLVIGVLVLGGAFSAYQALVASKPEITPDPPTERIWPVSAVPALPADAKPTLHFYGEIVPGEQGDVRALVSGRVASTSPSFRNGSLVNSQELLVSIDPFEHQAALEQAHAALNEAKARSEQLLAQLKQQQDALVDARDQLSLLQRDVNRTEELARQNVASQRTLDNAMLQLSKQNQAARSAENALATQRALLKQQEAAVSRAQIQLRLAQRDLQNTAVLAPFNGFLSQINASLGSRLNTNDRIAQIVNALSLEARFNISNAQYGRLSSQPNFIGSDLDVVWRVGSQPQFYEGRIERVAALVDADSGGVDIFASILNLTLNTRLRPGAFVEIILQDRSYPNVLSIPPHALADGGRVYVVDENQRMQPKSVTVAGADGDNILIDASPFRAGELIITTIFPEAAPGARVEVSIANELNAQPRR